MNVRHVFSTPDLTIAQSVVAAAEHRRIPEDHIFMAARPEIEEVIPARRQEADSDFMPAALRGAALGAGAGLLTGVIAMAFLDGITVMGVFAVTAVGAMLGGWGAAMAGSSLQDPVRRKFEAEIRSGQVLVIIDGEPEQLTAVEPFLLAAGARRLPFEATTALLR